MFLQAKILINGLRIFKIEAINSGISKTVVDQISSDAKFLPKVIEYDRYQPEFYEDIYLCEEKERQKIKSSKV